MIARVTATAFFTAILDGSTPVSVTTPSIVFTLTCVLFRPSAVASSLFTLVVIHVSVTGWFDSVAMPLSAGDDDCACAACVSGAAASRQAVLTASSVERCEIPQMEAVLKCADGGTKAVVVAGQPIDMNGEAGMLFTFMDLEPRKQAGKLQEKAGEAADAVRKHTGTDTHIDRH